MSVLVKTESYLMGDGRWGKLSRETFSAPGRHGAGGAMCRARMEWADSVIRQKVG